MQSAIKFVNLYQQSGSSNLIGWKLEMGVTSFYSAGQGLMMKFYCLLLFSMILYAYSEDPDQTVHKHSLILTSTVCICPTDPVS